MVGTWENAISFVRYAELAAERFKSFWEDLIKLVKERRED